MRPYPHLLTVGLTLLAVVGVAMLLWRLADVLILLFAAIVVAAILYRIAKVLEDHTPLHAVGSRIVGWLMLTALLAGFLFLLGAQTWSQIIGLGEELPELLTNFGDMVGVANLSQVVSNQLAELFDGADIFGDIAGITASSVGALGALLLVVFGGAFLAVNPKLYRDGVTALLPAPWHERTRQALDGAAQALSGWLIGKLITMVLVGIATTLGLMLIGVPSALALGLLAGLLEFIPLIGPILSAVPALLVALPEGMDTLLWVIALYVAVQQVESNLLVPIIQQRTAELPPVLGLFAIVAFGSLFGFAGIVVAAPLTIVLMSLTKQLYVKDILGRDIGSKGKESGDD